MGFIGTVIKFGNSVFPMYVTMLLLTPQFMTENINVHNKEYQW